MKIAHLQKTSLIEYPGKISAVIFTQGCNLRCPYCHNPELVRKELFTEPIPEQDFFSFLSKRAGKLDGLVITGGEPAIQKGLIDFMHRVRDLGYLIKLDTNGTVPDVLELVIKNRLADYIAMDIKGPSSKYHDIAGVPVDMDAIRKSIGLVMGSGLDYEFRTTWAAGQLTPEDMIETAAMARNANRFAIQRFKPSKHLDPMMLKASPPSEDEAGMAISSIRGLVKECLIR